MYTVRADMPHDDLDARFADALLRGRLLKLLYPPLQIALREAMSQHLDQGGEGLIPIDAAVSAAYTVFASEIDRLLKSCAP
jgi:hypothetical protein